MGTSQTITPIYERDGQGSTYTGSLQEHHGKTVQGISDCSCPPCTRIDLWDMARRAVVLLTDGTRLEHVRWASIT